jgi:hypothetical protein
VSTNAFGKTPEKIVKGKLPRKAEGGLKFSSCADRSSGEQNDDARRQ